MKMKNRFDFIHIGMPKCMSSHLQEIWRCSENFSSIRGRLLADEIDNICKNLEGQNSKIEIIQLSNNLIRSINFPKSVQGKKNIFTEESFTSPIDDLFFSRQKILAKTLANTSEKALILIRNPLDWILSFYAQEVKMGLANENFKEWVFQNKNRIYCGLNISKILSIWGKYFKIILIPIEISRDTRSRFGNIYYKNFGELPEKIDSDYSMMQSNITNYDSLNAFGRLNTINNFMRISLEKNTSSKKQAVDFYNSFLAYTRNFCTYASKNEINELKNKLKLEESRIDLKVDDALLVHIRRKFINPIKINYPEFKDILSEYEKKLAENCLTN